MNCKNDLAKMIETIEESTGTKMTAEFKSRVIDRVWHSKEYEHLVCLILKAMDPNER